MIGFAGALAVGDRVELREGGYACVIDVIDPQRVRIRDATGRLRACSTNQLSYCPEPDAIRRGVERIQRSWFDARLRRQLGLMPLHGVRPDAG